MQKLEKHPSKFEFRLVSINNSIPFPFTFIVNWNKVRLEDYHHPHSQININFEIEAELDPVGASESTVLRPRIA